MKKLPLIFLPFLFFQLAAGQQKEGYQQKNNLFVQMNHHLEKRGTDKWEFSFPDFAIGDERDVAGFGDHRFYAGLRTGLYREYVLTGNGWDHPVGSRFFLGFSPSYVFHFSGRFRFQVSFLSDFLLPNDYDEIWLYWAVEASSQYFFNDFYVGISATSGAFFFFDPRANMIKAGIKAGYRF
jgi:hypothetical protein